MPSLERRPHRDLIKTAVMTAVLLLYTAILAACGDVEEADRARALRDEVIAADYTAWASPGPFATRQPSETLHLDEVRVFFDAPMAALHQSAESCATYAEANPQLAPDSPFILDAGVTEWPDGSTLVKEGYSGGDLGILAIMRKEQGEWFFAEFDGDGEILFSGRPDICTSCHVGAMHDSTFTSHLTRLCPPPSQL